MNHLLAGKNKPGTLGTLMPGAEIKLVNPGPNGDGEICYRGRHVFMGYLKQEEKTRDSINGTRRGAEMRKREEEEELQRVLSLSLVDQ